MEIYKYVRYDILSTLINDYYQKFPFLIIETNLLKFDMDRTNDFIIPGDPLQVETL